MLALNSKTTSRITATARTATKTITIARTTEIPVTVLVEVEAAGDGDTPPTPPFGVHRVLFDDGILAEQSLSTSMLRELIFGAGGSVIHSCSDVSRSSMVRSEVTSKTPSSVTYVVSSLSLEQFKVTRTMLVSARLRALAISEDSILGASVLKVCMGERGREGGGGERARQRERERGGGEQHEKGEESEYMYVSVG